MRQPRSLNNSRVSELSLKHKRPRAGNTLLTRRFKAADRQLGLLAALTATVPDARASARVTHGVGDLLAQRVFAIACGHPDGNDADLSFAKNDPVSAWCTLLHVSELAQLRIQASR